jgi:hypothetical protein
VGDPDAPPLDTESLVRELARHRVAYVLVGGVAAVAHGATRGTFDLDIVPSWRPENLAALAAALRSMHGRLRVPGVRHPVDVPLDGSALSRYEVSTWRTDHGDIDVIVGTPRKARRRLASFDELSKRARRRKAFGVDLLIANLDDIIEAKEALGRRTDLLALPELRELRAASARKR